MRLRTAFGLVAVSLTLAAGCSDDAGPASNTSAPGTSAPGTSAPGTSDLQVIEAGVAAFYSGDADRAAQLFELTDRTDDQIRAESAYQAAIGGRVDLRCSESAPGSFNCTTPYRNALTDAIGEGGGHDTWPVEVHDGVITKFGFTEHSGILNEMGTFLASEDRFDGFEKCLWGPFPASCATIEQANLEAWAAWHKTVQPADRIKAVVESWYRGDCEPAVLLSWGDAECSASSMPAQAAAYESILRAQATVENCAPAPGGADPTLSCSVRYSNAMSGAVDKAPALTTRVFVLKFGVMPAGPDEKRWFEVDYPEDSELRDSFRRFAEGGDLAGAFADAGCASTRSPACANLIMANLDAWATWYATNH